MNLSHPTYQPLKPGQEIATSGEVLAWPARHCPDKTGLICGDRRWTFAGLDRLANRFAHAVLQQFRQRPGPVGIMGNNSAEYAIAHFGIARTGRFSVNFPTRCTREDLAFAITCTRPAVILVDAGSRPVVEEACCLLHEKPELVCIAGEPAGTARQFWHFIESMPATPPAVEVDPDGPGSVIFTGGTTGKPKAVLSSQRGRAISAMSAIEDFRIREDSIAGYTVPFTHTAGLFSWFQPAVLAGCTGVIIPAWDPETFMQLTEKHGISVTFAVPAQLAQLLEHPRFEPSRLRSLQMIAFGGAPLSRDLIERAEKVMPWLECARAYGSTETGHLAAQRKHDRIYHYDGYNQAGGRLEIEIFREPGIVAGEGEVGEIATRGAHLMLGYLGNEEANREFFKTGSTDGEWGWMGDLAVKHGGYFSIVGRSKHMILSGGLNIYPAELEAILNRHPAVRECVVFGIEDPVWGELPAAAIIPRDNTFDSDAVLEYVSGKVARFKRIRRIFIVDRIPRTIAGKVQVHLLKEQCMHADDKTMKVSA